MKTYLKNKQRLEKLTHPRGANTTEGADTPEGGGVWHTNNNKKTSELLGWE